jgi:hypothetical protein
MGRLRPSSRLQGDGQARRLAAQLEAATASLLCAQREMAGVRSALWPACAVRAAA